VAETFSLWTTGLQTVFVASGDEIPGLAIGRLLGQARDKAL
jgi:hypothetical protein